ncbi:MAG: acetolactate synthase small subunit [Candidatus Dormibacteraeota bacterium]|jgi:acetolactate synthase I/III small subunit|nr:acetolactate synthase small subunit [Candidatus Dormibacteraeota bacterium]
MTTPEIARAQRLRVLTAVVEDHPGVLSRVSGMIRRRGFNIHGLSVGPTGVPGRSRMTLTVDAGHAEVDQVEKQLDRLIEVLEIEDLTETPRINRELALVKLAVDEGSRSRALTEIDRLGGRVLDEDREQLIVELSGEFERVEIALEALRSFRIVDLARSGPVAISKSRDRGPARAPGTQAGGGAG